MNHSKIQLSAQEMELVASSSWILTKHRIIEKVYHLFGNLSTKMQAYLEDKAALLPAEVLQSTPKISKGEQYEALPYAVLDYPRVFSKENIFAVRSFFWWGNYFSITLHLKGVYLQRFAKKITAAIAGGTLHGFHCSCSGNEFSFNVTDKNYFLMDGNNNEKYTGIEQAPFAKICYTVAFEHWDTAEEKILLVFQQLMILLAD